jgi:2'-5' RNA ligase
MPSELFAFTVPFRDLAPAVDEWRERSCEAKPSHGVPPHVTLLIPAPPDVAGAAEALAPFGSFDVTFARLDRFPGTLWLAPEPSDPFVAMTRALLERFPDHAPYRGLFKEITPHLTVAQGADSGAAETALRPLLPLGSRAASVVLFEQVAPDHWRENAEFAL